MNCLLLTPNTNPTQLNNQPLWENTPTYLERHIITNKQQVAHIKQVLKLEAGEKLKVGIKGGCLGSAIVGEVGKDYIELKAINCHQKPPQKLDLTVILAMCRPKVLRRLIMDMTALGVQRIVIINSYRSQKSYWQSPLLTRINEFVDEGLQQSVDTIAPQVLCRKRFKPFVEDELALWLNGISLNQSGSMDEKLHGSSNVIQDSHTLKPAHTNLAHTNFDTNEPVQKKRPSAIVAHPNALYTLDEYLSQQVCKSTPLLKNTQFYNRHFNKVEDCLDGNLDNFFDNPSAVLSATALHSVLPQYICIGPEGGWIDYEVNLLEKVGCTPVSLGKRILRTEAAVNVLCGRYVCATV